MPQEWPLQAVLVNFVPSCLKMSSRVSYSSMSSVRSPTNHAHFLVVICDAMSQENQCNPDHIMPFSSVTCLSVSVSPADVSGVDWMVRHGRSLALAIAVKSAPERLCVDEYSSSVLEAVLSSATADRVRAVFRGM